MTETGIDFESQQVSLPAFQLITSESEGVGVAPGATGVPHRERAAPLGTERAAPREAQRLGREQPAGLRGNMDKGLLRRTAQIVESIEDEDAYQTEINLVALAGIIADLWDSAERSSETHQDILAALDNGVLLAKRDCSVTDEQLRAMREAIHDLGEEHLVREHAEIIRARFVTAGFAPFGFLDCDPDA